MQSLNTLTHTMCQEMKDFYCPAHFWVTDLVADIKKKKEQHNKNPRNCTDQFSNLLNILIYLPPSKKKPKQKTQRKII